MLDDLRRDSPEPMVYLPAASPSPAYVVRSSRAHELAPQVRDLIREHIPESPMYRVFTMEQLVANSMASLSFTMLMLSIVAGLAVILGFLGLYAVLSYVVTRQTREIAVRLALGGQAQRIRRLVVLRGGRVALLGVAIGVLIALGATRFLESLLFGIETLDPSTFVATSVAMMIVAFLASYIPARRASSVDPMESLRAD
jgi:ABC-type antimicrobial peptide transport system permease subunit